MVAYSLRISNRSKKSVSYAESDDEKDSDYEPTPKRARNTNVGLREPSKSQLLAHARSKQSRTLQAAKESPAVLPGNSERNKKCPYCETSFYYEKVLTAILNMLTVTGYNQKVLPFWAQMVIFPCLLNQIHRVHQWTVACQA